MVLLKQGWLAMFGFACVVLALFHCERWSVEALALSKSFAIKDEQILLPNGVKAQVLSGVPSRETKKAPILFLHGSFHGAWCWQEEYMPFFLEEGHPCVAMSWRGTGGTPAPEGVTKVRVVEDHCQDLQSLLETLPSIFGAENVGEDLRPIVVSHSMGGVIVMKYLEEQALKSMSPKDAFRGIVSLCSVPPSGNSKTTMRYLRRSLVDTYKITVGFVLKKVITDETICRDCFFGGPKKYSDDGSLLDDFGISDEDLARYQKYMERDTKAILDVSDLNRVVPSKNVDPRSGRAPFSANLPPCLVVGATRDFIVDEIANEETAYYYGVENPIYVDSPHDIMLGRNWKEGAIAVRNWIESTIDK